MKHLSLLICLIILLLCAADLALASPVRLRYIVQPVEIEYWERKPDATFLERRAHEAFRLVNASPRIVTILEVMTKFDDPERKFTFCFFGFHSLEIVIEKLNTRVNISYIFWNFSFVCYGEGGEYFWWLVNRAPQPVRREEYLFWLSNIFVFTRSLTVDPVTGDVRDVETGEPLGEWVYQLRQWELGRNSTVVLATCRPLPTDGFNGHATIVYVNFSLTAGKDYVLNNGKVIVSTVRTTVGTSLYSNRYATIIYGLPTGFTVDQAKRLTPPGFRFADFGNGTYALMCDHIYDTYEKVKELKPWILERERREHRYDKAPPWVDIIGVVRYGGASYRVTPLFSVTLVYDRVTGVLLEAVPGLPEVPWLHLDHLPPPLPNYFGASIWRVISEKPLALRLVESSLHEPEAKLGGVGRVDVTAHAAIVAAAALIVLLQAERRRLVRR